MSALQQRFHFTGGFDYLDGSAFVCHWLTLLRADSSFTVRTWLYSGAIRDFAVKTRDLSGILSITCGKITLKTLQASSLFETVLKYATS